MVDRAGRFFETPKKTDGIRNILLIDVVEMVDDDRACRFFETTEETDGISFFFHF